MKYSLLLLTVAITGISCQKTYEPEENKCQLIRTEWERDQSQLSHNYLYDDQNRIKYIVQLNGPGWNDTTQIEYDGQTTRMLGAKLSHVTEPLENLVYTYSADGLVNFIHYRFGRAALYYKGNKLDSAVRFMTPSFDSTNWEIARYSTFEPDPQGSIVGHRSELNGYGESESFEYTEIKNPLKHLGFLNFQGHLYLDDIFPLCYFGYADDYLVKRHTSQTFDSYTYTPRPVHSLMEYRYDYDFDAAGNLVASEVSLYIDGVLTQTTRHKFYYDCN